MAINGYLVHNITKTSDKFLKQLETWKESFNSKKINIKLVNNINAFNIIKNDSEKIDFVLFYDKDIALMYELLSLNIRLFNNVDAIRLCDDKAYTYAYLIKNKITTPKTVVLPLTFFENVEKYFDEIKELVNIEGIKYPFVVKERRSSLGLGVFLIHNDLEFRNILKLRGDKELLVQEYIGYEKGKDYRVFVINHRPKIVVTRTNKNDFRSNVELGGKMEKLENPDEELLKIAMKTSLSLNMDFGAIDIVKDQNNKYYVLEANSNAFTINLDKLSKESISKQIVNYIVEHI